MTPFVMTPFDDCQSRLLAAQDALLRRDLVAAECLFNSVLGDPAHSSEASSGLARVALLLGRPREAGEHLQAALALDAGNIVLRRNLGIAQHAGGALAEARETLLEALRLDPQQALTRLHLAQVMQQAGDLRGAAQHYYRALLLAQSKGQWLDEFTTPAHLRNAVLRAMDVVDRERGGLLDRVLDPFRQTHGAAALARVQHCLDGHLKRIALVPTDPLQRPRFLYFPGLPSPTFLPLSLFPWIESLQSGWTAISDEAAQTLSQPAALRPFLNFESEEQIGAYLQGGAAPSWDAAFFYREGACFPEQHARCPNTSAALEALPLVRIREHAPEICFSVLAPETHILPHTGVTNIRLVAHLPLIIPPDCAISVGGETHVWREGEVVIFDDTFEHEAWNRSDRPRVVLLMDTWNPYLTPVEQQAMSALIGEIGDFNRA
ncbi:MAG: aspartyl/asparaginyl beta-hydroxylase domain-containing protein [Pseudomonadota bacterium]|nr:aspartyl/asparaginyl beta-hydroxylase domain-containing protein [Pseudomonadota bacterium]